MNENQEPLCPVCGEPAAEYEAHPAPRIQPCGHRLTEEQGNLMVRLSARRRLAELRRS